MNNKTLEMNKKLTGTACAKDKKVNPNQERKAFNKKWKNFYKAVESVSRGAEDYLQERADRQKDIDEVADGRKLFVVVWSRDCDMCEGTSLSSIAATIMSYERFEAEQHENAEGPVSISFATREQAQEFSPTFRDRIGEAWDNGNTSPHCV